MPRQRDESVRTQFIPAAGRQTCRHCSREVNDHAGTMNRHLNHCRVYRDAQQNDDDDDDAEADANGLAPLMHGRAPAGHPSTAHATLSHHVHMQPTPAPDGGGGMNQQKRSKKAPLRRATGAVDSWPHRRIEQQFDEAPKGNYAQDRAACRHCHKEITNCLSSYKRHLQSCREFEESLPIEPPAAAQFFHNPAAVTTTTTSAAATAQMQASGLRNAVNWFRDEDADADADEDGNVGREPYTSIAPTNHVGAQFVVEGTQDSEASRQAARVKSLTRNALNAACALLPMVAGQAGDEQHSRNERAAVEDAIHGLVMAQQALRKLDKG